jgi:hypothetical protein
MLGNNRRDFVIKKSTSNSSTHALTLPRIYKKSPSQGVKSPLSRMMLHWSKRPENDPSAARYPLKKPPAATKDS